MPDDALGLLSPAQVNLTPGDQSAAITSIETYALSIPLAQTLANSTASLRAWTVPVVEIRTADGTVGTGIFGVHCCPELLCQVIDRYYAPALDVRRDQGRRHDDKPGLSPTTRQPIDGVRDP